MILMLHIFKNHELANHFICRSVHPLNGPIQGGTIVTITGNDLGIGLNSIDGIMFGDYPCIIIPSEYQPGKMLKLSSLLWLNFF